MKNLTYLLFIVIFLGCKNESNKTELQPIVKKEFLIEMNFKVNKADEFRFMVNNIIYDKYQRKNIQILEKVEISDVTDFMSANFGEEISKNVILNFGGKEQKEIIIESMTISFGNNILSINKFNLKKYFTLNKFISQEEDTGTLITEIIDGKHSPALILRPSIINKLIEEK